MKIRSILAASVSLGGVGWLAVHRRSAAVEHWRPTSMPGHDYSALYARVGGAGAPTVVLLHGLVATGDIFGARYDTLACHGRLIVPDLLGFGRSLDPARSHFELADHLAALDDLLSQVGTDGPVIIGGHSMGAGLALQWAAQHLDRVQRVVCWGAPLYADEPAVRAAIARTGLMARLFATDTSSAKRLCSWNCEHRVAAGLIAAAVTPSLPIAIARSASLHTWDAYRDALTGLVMATDWEAITARLDSAGVPTRFVWGSDDPIGDRSLATAMARDRPLMSVESVGGADHHLPISHPEACIGHLSDSQVPPSPTLGPDRTT